MHPVLIHLGPLTLSTYGTLVAIAYLTGILWLKAQIPDMPGMTEEKFWTMVYGLFFGAIAGGKLLFLVVEWRAFMNGELSLFRDFRYGFVFFGGLLGAIGMGFLVQRWIKVPYLATADYIGVALPMGHWIGRLGCLAAGCCYGKPTAVPWAVRLGGSPMSSTPVALWGVPLHPTQLYESAADLLICLFLLKRLLPLAKKGRLPPGTVFFSYIFLYSVARFFNEFLRGDDRGATLLGLYVSQWISMLAIAILGAVLARSRKELRPAVGL